MLPPTKLASHVVVLGSKNCLIKEFRDVFTRVGKRLKKWLFWEIVGAAA